VHDNQTERARRRRAKKYVTPLSRDALREPPLSTNACVHFAIEISKRKKGRAITRVATAIIAWQGLNAARVTHESTSRVATCAVGRIYNVRQEAPRGASGDPRRGLIFSSQ